MTRRPKRALLPWHPVVKMQRPHDPPRGSYIGSALRQRENQLAAGITLLVAIFVALFMQRPLPVGTVIELAEPDGFGLMVDYTPLHFWKAEEYGRWTSEPEARILLNRPLPSEGTLVIEAFGIGAYRGVPVEFRVGPSRQQIAFGEKPKRVAMDFENDGDVHEIGLALPPLTDAQADELHALGLTRITVAETQ